MEIYSNFRYRNTNDLQAYFREVVEIQQVVPKQKNLNSLKP